MLTDTEIRRALALQADAEMHNVFAKCCGLTRETGESNESLWNRVLNYHREHSILPVDISFIVGKTAIAIRLDKTGTSIKGVRPC